MSTIDSPTDGNNFEIHANDHY